MRRFASTGQRTDLAVCASLPRKSSPPPRSQRWKSEEVLQGRSLQCAPELVTALAAAGGGSLSLKIRQGDSSSIDEALKTIEDEKAAAGKRIEYATIFGEVKQEKAIPILLQTLTEDRGSMGLKAAILTTLDTGNDPQIAIAVLAQYGNFNKDVCKRRTIGCIGQLGKALSLMLVSDKPIVARSPPRRCRSTRSAG